MRHSDKGAGCEDYVCPTCFRRLDKCTCEFHPWNLINVDRNIQEQIRILNEKGYRTRYCCESHNPQDGIYIAFAQDYEPPYVPDGFVMRKNGAMYHTYKGATAKSWELYEKDKEKYLSVLLDWCVNLPTRCIDMPAADNILNNVFLPAC